jgi:ABC-type enterobactin transport system permease subunit
MIFQFCLKKFHLGSADVGGFSTGMTHLGALSLKVLINDSITQICLCLHLVCALKTVVLWTSRSLKKLPMPLINTFTLLIPTRIYKNPGL